MKHILLISMFLWQGFAQAEVAYNLTGWDATGAEGADGGFPASWTGGIAPSYTGSLNAMWFANVSGAGSENVSSSDARTKGADPTFALAVGPRAWSSDATGTLGKGHGSDFGLIHLADSSNLIITLAADSVLGSSLKPGFSLFQGWDTGSTADRLQDFQNNQNNPLGTVGLTFLNSASTVVAGGTASHEFINLAAGDYTLFVGGNATVSAGSPGKYTVSLAASPVPLPGAVYLFGTALAGLIASGRNKQKIGRG